jgi:Fe-S cluster assembly protein SufB
VHWSRGTQVPDFSMVTTRLATGAAISGAEDVAALFAAGITAVVDLRAEFDDTPLLAGSGLAYLWNGTADDGAPKPPSWFAASLAFALPLLAQPHQRVYCHCVPSGVLVGGRLPVPIEMAEEVTGHDGAEHKVLARSERHYAGPLAVIESTGTLPLRLTPGHPVLVVRPYRWPNGQAAKPGTPTWRGVTPYIEHYRAQPEWITAGMIRAGDYLVAPRPAFTGEAAEVPWPLTGHVNERHVSPLVPDADTAWMLGLYAADGGTAGSNGIMFTLAPGDDLDRLVRVWRRMGLTPLVRDAGTYRRVTVSSRPVSRAMRGWCGHGDSKRLPAFVFSGWPLRDVIDGYVSGDGHLDSHGTITCSTISLVLAEQVRAALLSVGESPTVRALRRRSGYPNARQGYAIRWSPAAIQRHTAWWRGVYLMPVISTGAESYDGLVHNLDVADAHTYTVGGATVHNCAAGINRGPSTAYSLMRALGWPAADAEAAIRAARPQVGLAYKGDADAAVAALGYA